MRKPRVFRAEKQLTARLWRIWASHPLISNWGGELEAFLCEAAPEYAEPVPMRSNTMDSKLSMRTWRFPRISIREQNEQLARVWGNLVFSEQKNNSLHVYDDSEQATPFSPIEEANLKLFMWSCPGTHGACCNEIIHNGLKTQHGNLTFSTHF